MIWLNFTRNRNLTINVSVSLILLMLLMILQVVNKFKFIQPRTLDFTNNCLKSAYVKTRVIPVTVVSIYD